MSKVGRKNRIKWREIIFNLHRKDLSEAFDLFRANHPGMSINRCAYYVLKTFYSTTILDVWRSLVEDFGQSYEKAAKLSVMKAQWC